MPGVNVPAIKVNTVGYPPDWAKLAVFNVPPEGAVVRAVGGEVAYTVAAGDVRARGQDPASGDDVWWVDFSALTDEGRYVLEQGAARSDAFDIAQDLYGRALTLALKQFYFQRCRTPLTAPYAVFEGDAFTRDRACHQHAGIAWDLTEYPEHKTRWTPDAGWHDAGNFEMYVPSTAPTAQALLMAYEAHPELFPDGQLEIPESGNGIPDLLDEARWGLRWVLSMQDPSGGFRNREAVMKWGEPGPADADDAVHWVSGVGTASTAKATAALSVAARVYQPHDPFFAEQCEKAARRGWDFLQAHSKRIVVDSKGSPQPLWDDGAEYSREGGSRLLAAAEVWRTFRDAVALEHTRRLLRDPQTQVDEFLRGAWVNMARWALMTLALDPETPDEIRDEAKARLLKAAIEIRNLASTGGYRVASSPDDYYWGSNSNLMERTHLLLTLYRLDPTQPWALAAAQDQWHWLLGRNPNGYSMVTRVGKGPTRVYHLEWGRKARMPPGILVGGPNGKEGAFLSPTAPAKALLWDNPNPIAGPIPIPAHAMWHTEQAALWDGQFARRNDWSVGWWIVAEGDVYYNANLVLVATEMHAQSLPERRAPGAAAAAPAEPD